MKPQIGQIWKFNDPLGGEQYHMIMKYTGAKRLIEIRNIQTNENEIEYLDVMLHGGYWTFLQ